MDLYVIESFILIGIEAICCKNFYEIFTHKRYSYKWVDIAVIIGMTIYSYVIATIFNNNFVIKELCLIAGIGLIMLIYIKTNFVKSIFLAILFQAVLLAVDYIVLWMNVMVFDNSNLQQSDLSIEGNLLLILGKIILFLIVLLIGKFIGSNNVDVLTDMEWIKFTIFPVFTICIISAMIVSIKNGNINSDSADIYIITAVCLACLNITVFYYICDVLKNEKKIHESEMFAIRVKNQTDMYRSIFENFEKQRRKTHEFRNHIMCVQGLVERKEYDKLEEYIDNISSNLKIDMDAINTNNVIVDAILNSKYQEIVDKGICFVFKINNLSEISISDEDIVVILSNMINNAIEACEKCSGDKVIKVKFIKEKSNIIISVKNTYNGVINIRDGKIQSSKLYEKEQHGIGIDNIIDVVDKYSGIYSIEHTDSEFYFSIMIPITIPGKMNGCLPK